MLNFAIVFEMKGFDYETENDCNMCSIGFGIDCHAFACTKQGQRLNEVFLPVDAVVKSIDAI